MLWPCGLAALHAPTHMPIPDAMTLHVALRPCSAMPLLPCFLVALQSHVTMVSHDSLVLPTLLSVDGLLTETELLVQGLKDSRLL